MKFFALAILLISFIGITTAAVNCYNCTYWEGDRYSEEDCKETNPGAKYSINCPTPNNSKAYCRKIETIIDEKKIIHRSCFHTTDPVDLADQCPKLLEKTVIKGFGFVPKGTLDCYCTRDKCNGAAGKTINFSLASAAAILLVKFYAF